jgi:hypothetical protein
MFLSLSSCVLESAIFFSILLRSAVDIKKEKQEGYRICYKHCLGKEAGSLSFYILPIRRP